MVLSMGFPHESHSNGVVSIILYNLALKKVWQKQEKQLLLLGGCSQSSLGMVGHTKWILCVSLSVSLPVYGASKSADLIWIMIRIIYNNLKREWFWELMGERADLFFKNVTVEAVEEYLLALGINSSKTWTRNKDRSHNSHMLCL